MFPLHSPQAEGGCSCNCSDCASIGKHPRTANGVLDATNDLQTICDWWSEWPEANIGLATGGGVYVIDVDGERGRGSLTKLETEFGPLPRTLTAETGRDGGGQHRFYRVPQGVELRNAAGKTLGEGIDGRGEGGYVVVAPSVHRSGREYRFVDPSVRLAQLPDPLMEYLSGRPAEKGESLTDEHLQAFRDAADALTAYDRERLQRRAEGRLTWAVDNLRRLPREESNGRGHAFFASACFVGSGIGAGVLNYHHTLKTLEACAKYLGLDDHHQAWRSIRNGLARGAANPLAPSAPSQIHGRRGNRSRGGTVALTRMSDVRAEPVSWAWDGLIPLRNLSLLVGHPGLGKSQLLALLAAQLSTGTCPGDLLGAL